MNVEEQDSIDYSDETVTNFETVLNRSTTFVDMLPSSYSKLLESYYSDIETFKNTQVEKKYQLGDMIGKGGMKTVFDAYDQELKRTLAMATQKNPEDIFAAQRFIQEARLTAQLQHPNIVPIHEIGVKDSKLYFTMKRVEGESLSQILKELEAGNPDYKSKYSLITLIQIFLKVCDAVRFAHSKGVLHLDLKPANIQIGKYGEVLVLDWGLAKVIKREALFEENSDSELQEKDIIDGISIDGEVCGTLGYMAPEQAAGTNKPKDIRTDIYALGAILYAILTYKSSIEGDNIDDMLQKTVNGKIESPSKRAPDRTVPKALEAIVKKAMSCKPEDRYNNVEKIERDIQAYLEGFTTSAEDATLWRHTQLFMKRRKKECIYSLASLLVIIIFSMVAYKQVRHSENKLNRFVKSNRYRYHVFKTKGDQLLKKGRKEEALELYEKANAVKKRAKTEQAICQLLDEIIAEHIKARNWSAAALFVQKGMHYPNLKEKMENLVPYVTGKGYVSIHSTLAGVIKEYLTTNKASLSLTAPQAYTIKEYGPLPLPKMVFYEGTHHFIIQTDDGHQIYLPIELKRGETLDINIPIKSIPEGYVYVHKGDFIYGGENSVSPWNSAGPYKRSLPGFFMKKQPITLAEYEAFRHSPKYVSCLNSVLKKHNLDWKQLDMEINSIEELKPSTLNKSIKSDYVSGLSYYEALAYAKWSNSRLPTEFEWEKAARGIDGRLFLTGNTIKKDFSKTISPYGCVGLGHTVRLWTSTDYGGSRNRKVVKGSLPACSPQNLLLSSRKAFTPVVKYSSIGLITCKDISDATQQSVASFENKSKEQLLQQK